MSEKNNKYTPNLRFPEFSGEWEEKTLGEVAKKVNRKNTLLKVSRVLTNSANLGVVDQGAYFDRDIAVKENTGNYSIVEIEDFVYNPRISTAAPVGPISINKVGQGIMSPLYTVFKFHTGCISFYEQYFQTTIWHDYLKGIANFGARFDRMNITTEGFFNMPLYLPIDPTEQEKIASCLSAMDELIAAQAEKVDALKAKKTGMMQQLFPRKGETTPRLRFPEFTGEWEVKKLGEISPVIFDGTHQTPHYVNNGIPFYSIENIVSDKPCKYIAQDEHMSNTRKNKTEKGDILITRIGTIGFAKIVDWDGEFSTYVSLATIKKSSLINTRYLLGYLQSEVYQKEMRSKSLMNAVPCKINMEDLKNTRIAVPKEQQEQEKIASCLSTLDDQIAAETEKLTALKDYKKGLMQQLFPQPAK